MNQAIKQPQTNDNPVIAKPGCTPFAPLAPVKSSLTRFIPKLLRKRKHAFRHSSGQPQAREQTRLAKYEIPRCKLARGNSVKCDGKEPVIGDRRGPGSRIECQMRLHVRERVQVGTLEPDAVFETAGEEVANGVGAIAGLEHKRVIVATADQNIVAGAAVQNVVAILAK